MVNIINFKKIEIVAESKEAAKAQMEETLFHYSGDATQAFNNWKQKQNGGVTERSIKEFMLDYLATKTKNCPGSGFLITLDSAVKDTRERPYLIEDVKNEGRRKLKTVYGWVDDETGVTICKSDKNKADAKHLLKELYKSGEYKGNASAEGYELEDGTALNLSEKDQKWEGLNPL